MKNISQLRAISYNYSRIEREKLDKKLAERGLTALFNNQSRYKTVRGFLNARTDVINALKVDAIEVLETRLQSLRECGARAYKIRDTLDALDEIRGISL